MQAGLFLQHTSSSLLDTSEMQLKLLTLPCFSTSVSPVTILLISEESFQQLGLCEDIVLKVGAVHILASAYFPQYFLKLQRWLPLRQTLAHINKTVQQLAFLSKVARLCPHSVKD